MEKFCSYRNGQLAYHITGTGPVVLLLHGFGEDASIWDEQVNFLKNAFTVITPFIPGTGPSALLQPSAENEVVLIEDYAKAIKQIIETEAITSFVMLGHSLGGYITLAFAVLYPDLLSGFGLIHSTAFADNAEKKENRIKGIRIMEEYGAYTFIKTTIPNLFGAKHKAAYPEKTDLLIEKAFKSNTVACQQYYEAMRLRPDRTDVLKNAQCPVLFIIGTEDKAAPMEDMLQQSHLPNCSYVHILPESGHMGMWEDTEIVNQHIRHFLNAIYHPVAHTPGN
ncbi:alpha/beta hydrolase [Hydrotalea sp.]|uniref:alpha/beta fold hydrolase n=1 Tax=Hydrotalea sp. TaxID=2881279 RepID=UPI002625D2C4|nr:alpha/beta hydrolase [Hydrotalea sp.]